MAKAQTLVLRGFEIRFLDIRTIEGGLVTRAHFETDYSESVLEKTGWPQLASVTPKMTLNSEFKSGSLVITPNDSLMKKYECNIVYDQIDSLEVKRVKVDGGDSHQVRLRGVVRCTGADSRERLVAFFEHVGQADSAAKMSYAEQATIGEASEESESDSDEAPKKAKRGRPPVDTSQAQASFTA